MKRNAHTIHIPDDSHLAHLLECVDTAPLHLEAAGVVYRVTREDESSTEYDPEKMRAVVDAATSTMTVGEGEASQAYIGEARE
jgi:hypothetical protein